MDCFLPSESALEAIKEKIATGDQQAFRQLFNFYSKKLIHFATSIVKSEEAAREVVDEVFIRIWRNRGSIGRIHNLRVYLYTASKNAALNYLSSRARENLSDPFDFFAIHLSDANACPEKKLINSELLKKINEAINSLPPRCRMVFKLIREDGLSYKEVGEVLNISPKTVDAQMVIAIRQICDKIQPELDYFPRRYARKK